MYVHRFLRGLLKNKTKIILLFIMTTSMSLLLLTPNTTLQVQVEQLEVVSSNCQLLDKNQHIQVSVNQKGLKPRMGEQAIDLNLLPGLKNPCWYETYDEQDLEFTQESPYQYPYNPAFTGPQNLFLDDINKIVDIYSEALQKNMATRLRCIPYFYILGQAKCATTDLYFRLSLHPMVRRGIVKESQWWAWSRQGVILENGTSLPLELADLADLYSHPALELEDMTDKLCEIETCQQPIIGDGSIYTWDAAFINMRTGKRRGTVLSTPLSTPEYIKWLIPGAKLILIARQPSERLYSAYKYFKNNKYVPSPEDFHKKVVKLLANFNRCISVTKSEVSCAYSKEFRNGQDLLISDSLYGLFIEKWLKIIGPENLLVIRTEDYKKNKIQTLRTAFKFLGLCDLTAEDEKSIVNMAEINKGQIGIGPMKPETKKLLDEFFYPYNEKMVKALNDERFYWNDYR